MSGDHETYSLPESLPRYRGVHGDVFEAHNASEGIIYEGFANRIQMAERFRARNRQRYLSPKDLKPIADPVVQDVSRFEGLALEVLEESRRELMMALRFLNVALWRMPFQRDDDFATFGTDGSALYFGTLETLRAYRRDAKEIMRANLHSIMHCVFRHVYDRDHRDRGAWSLACDISCELTILEMIEGHFRLPGDDARMEMGRELAALCKKTTPQALYRILIRDPDGKDILNEADWKELYQLFTVDSHRRWPCYNDEMFGYLAEEGKGKNHEMPHHENADISDPRGTGQSPDGTLTHQGHSNADLVGSGPNEDSDSESEADDGQPYREGDSWKQRGADDFDDAESEWEGIARQIEVDIRTSSHGSGAQTLIDRLAIANRAPADYSEFLRRFSHMAEDLIINDEEYDYLFYTLGLSLYGDMPLIEPLEYKETRRIRDFAIIVDTSESCSGEIVRRFIQRTFDILRQQQTFASRINLYLIQCDDQVRDAVKITSRDQLSQYLDSFEVRGGGGTDFRPAFAYVDELLDAGEFDDLKGVLYFTDGKGTFPKQPTPYETCFVFVDEGDRVLSVPPWAMRVVISEDEIMEFHEDLCERPAGEKTKPAESFDEEGFFVLGNLLPLDGVPTTPEQSINRPR